MSCVSGRHEVRKSWWPVATIVGLWFLGGGLFQTPAIAQQCPEFVGRWPYGPVEDVDVVGDFAYFGSGATLQIADVSNPASPQVVGEVALSGVVKGVVVSGDYAYVTTGGEGLRVINVATPTAPVEVGSYDTPGNRCFGWLCLCGGR